MKRQKILKQERSFVMKNKEICFCNKYYKKKPLNEKNCPICQIPLIFWDFEKDLQNYIFNEKLLWEYHQK